MTEIHRLVVDEYEPHAALEGRSQDLTACSGTAWMEMTHDATFTFIVHVRNPLKKYSSVQKS